MSDIAILKEMINKNAIEILEVRNGLKKVILREPDAPKSYGVTIEGMPDNNEVIIIKADYFVSPDKIFAGIRGECKRADFVIIADTKKKKVILCIEMKAGKGGSTSDIFRQLEGAKCFAEYCREIGQSFWSQPDFLRGYEYRFVSIKRITSKTKTRFNQTPDFSSKIKFLKRTGVSFQFNDLIQCRV